MPFYRPRNDYVILRRQKKGVKGLVMPDISAEGTEFIVETIGPDVVDLEIGANVMIAGNKNEDVVSSLPGESDLLFLRQHCIVYEIVEREEE